MKSHPTNPDMRTRKRQLTKLAALVLVVAGIATLIAMTVTPRTHSLVVKPVNDTICTTCMTVTGPSATPTLYPGAQASSMPVTFTNTTNGPIYITELDVSFTNTFPSSCTASNFVVGDSTPGATTSTTGTTTRILYSPAQTIPAGQTWTDTTTLSMPDSKAPQDGCEKLPLSLNYTGSANYTVLTTTGLSMASDPSTDSETLTATVAPDIQPASAAHTPGAGDGSVTFYSCSGSAATSCTTVLGSALVGSGGVAAISVSAASVGSYKIEAVFAPSDPTNFVTSSSPILTENLTGCVSAQTSGAGTVISAGQTYNGNLTVANGSSVWLDGGIINGNVAIGSTGQFAATGGTVSGNVVSSGGPIAMAGTTVTGNVQNSNGGLALGPSTVVKGNAEAQGGGPFCSQGASSTQGQVQVRGNLQIQSLTSPTTSSACATTVGNNLLWQANASPGIIGGTCGGDTVLGNLNVQSNSGTVTIGPGNTITGNTSVSGNTGGGSITSNTIRGNCTMSGDKPGITGSGNTTGKGNDQCNTTSTGA
jgi:hypothetical protein